MSISTSEAIVLRTFNLAEQDKIVVLFTKDKGIIRGVAKGARKFGNRFGSSLEPLSLVKTIYYEKETKDLVTLKSCELIESFFEIQKDLKIAYHFSYFSELIEEFFPLKSQEELTYRLLLTVLRAIKRGCDLSLTSRYFEMWILKIYGILPDFSRCRKCKKKLPQKAWLSPKREGIYCDSCASEKKESITSAINSFIKWARKSLPWETENISFSTEELKKISHIFQEIITYHLEKTPKTLLLLQSY